MFVMTVGLLINVVTMTAIGEGSTVSSTYYGVEGEEAIKKKQEELNHEKWAEMFGKDFKPEDIDFSNFDSSVKGKLGEAFKKFFKAVFGKNSESTTILPQ